MMKTLFHILILSILILGGCCTGNRQASTESELGNRRLKLIIVSGVEFNTAYPMHFVKGLQEQLRKHAKEKGEQQFHVFLTPEVLGYFSELEKEYKKNPAPPGVFDFDNAPANAIVRYFDEQMDQLKVEVRSDMILITMKHKKQRVEQKGRPNGLP
jgi:hypothetical protein